MASHMICFLPDTGNWHVAWFINLSFLVYNSWHLDSQTWYLDSQFFLSCSLCNARFSSFLIWFFNLVSSKYFMLTRDIAWNVVCSLDSTVGGIILPSTYFSFSYNFLSILSYFSFIVFSLSITRAMSLCHCFYFSANFNNLDLQSVSSLFNLSFSFFISAS